LINSSENKIEVKVERTDMMASFVLPEEIALVKIEEDLHNS